MEAGSEVPWLAVLLGTTRNHWPSANAACLQWYLPRKRPQISDVNDKPRYLDALTTSFYRAVSWVTQTSKDNHKGSLFLANNNYFPISPTKSTWIKPMPETQHLVFGNSRSKGSLWSQGEHSWCLKQIFFALSMLASVTFGCPHTEAGALPSQLHGITLPNRPAQGPALPLPTNSITPQLHCSQECALPAGPAEADIPCFPQLG